MPDMPGATEYDSPWKAIIEQFFPDFIAFFFPQAHAGVDWERGYQFLDKELQKVVRDSETGRRRVDKLVQVWRPDGEETWVAVHIEIQSQPDTDFARRMIQYHTLLLNHYGRQIVSLAVLSDARSGWRPDHFSYDLWGCRLRLDFPIVKLLDYNHTRQALHQSKNPFALVVMAHLQAQATNPASPTRRDAKFRLARRLYERGYSRREVLELFRFIDWVMTLTPDLEAEFETAIIQYEEERQMDYITSIERRGRKSGFTEGREQGLEEGLERSIMRILQQRFGRVPEALAEQLASLPAATLETLIDEAITAESLDAFVDEVTAVSPKENTQ